MHRRSIAMFSCSVVYSLVFLCAPTIGQQKEFQENWHNFRGPDFKGTSSTAKPPTNWGPAENIKWKIEIPGRGSASPVVWGDKVFIATAVNTQPPQSKEASDESGGRRPRRRGFRQRTPVNSHQFLAICVSRKDGSIVWRKIACERKPVEGHHPDGSFASASPTTDGNRVYFNFGSMGLYCYDLDGNEIWKRTDLGEMRMRGSFGEGSSVVIDGDRLVLPWDHEGDSHIEVIDKNSGDTIWKKNRDEPSNWATPIVASVDGKKQVLQAGQNYTRGYKLEDGTELWRASGLSERPVSSPVIFGKLGIFASARRGSVLDAYRLSGDEQELGKRSWRIDRQTPDCPSLLLSENRLFFLSGNKAILSCADASDGSMIFGPERLGGLSGVYSSPVAANGLVFVTSREGNTAVLKDDETFQVISTNQIGEPVDATLALVDNQILIRGKKHLFCVESN